jgi:hypothetical protein
MVRQPAFAAPLASSLRRQRRCGEQARALAESRRMSSEAAKSDEKRKRMYQEMGLTEEGMATMTNQHMGEVRAAMQAEVQAQAGDSRATSEAPRVVD